MSSRAIEGYRRIGFDGLRVLQAAQDRGDRAASDFETIGTLSHLLTSKEVEALGLMVTALMRGEPLYLTFQLANALRARDHHAPKRYQRGPRPRISATSGVATHAPCGNCSSAVP